MAELPCELVCMSRWFLRDILLQVMSVLTIQYRVDLNTENLHCSWLNVHKYHICNLFMVLP